MSRHPALETFDLDMRRTAALVTASDCTETEKLNDISDFSFIVPKNDSKIVFIQKRRFIRYNNGEAYRILDFDDVKNDTGFKEASCEHVLATLADDVMFQDHVAGNYGQDTASVIQFILSFQETKRWVLKRCDFHYFFEYGWSSENLLNALFSVFKPFTEPYKIETNTHVYPWELSVIRLDPKASPQFYIFERLNFLEERKKEQSSTVFTRLFGLGAGEGVNQVTIKDVNNGVPYIDAPPAAMREHGLISGVCTAREYDTPEALKAYLDALLPEVCDPRIEYSVKAVDLHEINGRPLLDAKVGKIIQCSDGYRTYITEIGRKHDDPGNMSLKLSQKPKDLANMIASLADRQRIESTYSQGATQLWSNTTADNASPSDGHVHPIWMPEDAKIINKVMMRIELSRFRTYSKTTSTEDGSTPTSSSSGGGSTTSESNETTNVTSGASSNKTTAIRQTVDQGHTGYTSIGYATVQTGTANSHSHSYIRMPSSSAGYGQHRHYYSWSGEHSHGMDHTHSIQIDGHTHRVSGIRHSHTVDIPSHSHQLEYGIFTANVSAASAMVYVENVYAFSMGTSFEGDITRYLVSQDGKIPRGRFIKIKVVPNAIARVTASSATQAFIQSKTGGNY